MERLTATVFFALIAWGFFVPALLGTGCAPEMPPREQIARAALSACEVVVCDPSCGACVVKAGSPDSGCRVEILGELSMADPEETEVCEETVVTNGWAVKARSSDR